jgi:uncharacterized membrane protein
MMVMPALVGHLLGMVVMPVMVVSLVMAVMVMVMVMMHRGGSLRGGDAARNQASAHHERSEDFLH